MSFDRGGRIQHFGTLPDSTRELRPSLSNILDPDWRILCGGPTNGALRHGRLPDRWPVGRFRRGDFDRPASPAFRSELFRQKLWAPPGRKACQLRRWRWREAALSKRLLRSNGNRPSRQPAYKYWNAEG